MTLDIYSPTASVRTTDAGRLHSSGVSTDQRSGLSGLARGGERAAAASPRSRGSTIAAVYSCTVL